MMNPSPTPGSPRWRRRWLWVLLGMFVAGVTGIVFLPAETSEAIKANVTPVGEIQTNGEHWVLFRFDAPESRAVKIEQVLTVGGDRLLVPLLTRAESFPDSQLSVYERINAGGSKLVKVRRIGGGDWQLRVYFVVPLGLVRQINARLKASWLLKSLKPWDWNRTYIESGRRFVESEFVKTPKTVVASQPTPVLPDPATVLPSVFLPLPITTNGGRETGGDRDRER